MNDPMTPQIYTLSLHDALPISCRKQMSSNWNSLRSFDVTGQGVSRPIPADCFRALRFPLRVSTTQFRQFIHPGVRSEEHTSELQSRFDLVCRLLLEKKKYGCAL